MSTEGLLSLLGGVRKALETDDNLPPGEAKVYAVRAFSDWRTWANTLEKELARRNAKFEKINW